MSGGSAHSQALQDAVIAGDVERVSALIAAGADVLAKNPHGITALQIARGGQRPYGRRNRNLEAIIDNLTAAYRALPPERLSLQEAAEAGHLAALELRTRTAPGKIGANEFRNAIVSIVDDGYVEATELLLDAGVDANTRDARGLTLLMIAAGRGNDDVIKLLLSHGADVNATGAGPDRGLTATMIAAGNGKLSAVRRLVEAGASLATKDANGETALGYARQGGSKRTIAYLESAFERGGVSADMSLIDAARNGLLARVKELLLTEAADQTDPEGATALMRAAQQGHVEIVEVLCSAGADVHRTDSAGRNLWDYALAFGAKPDIVRCLIRHGLDPNRPDSSGMHPLIRSVMFSGGQDADEVVRALVDGGADVHATYTHKVPPHLAAHAAQLKAVGSKLADRIGRTVTAVDLAKQQGNRRAYEVLRGYTGAASDAYDAAMDELKQLAKKADAAFEAEAKRLGDLLRAKPQPWKKRKGVVHYFARLTEADTPATNVAAAADRGTRETAFLRRLQAETRGKGYALVYAEKDWQGKGLTRLLLFPTAQDVVALAASGTNGDNYGTGTREVVNWCAETARTNPFHVLGASFDSMELDSSRPVAEAEALARRIAIFCPDTQVDPENNVAVAAFARELAAHGCCFFWWD